MKKCGELYDEKVSAEVFRAERVTSAKEVMQVSIPKVNSLCNIFTTCLHFIIVIMYFQLLYINKV